MTTATGESKVSVEVHDPIDNGRLDREPVAGEVEGSAMGSVTSVDVLAKLNDSVDEVGMSGKGVIVIVPVKGVGKPGSGESVYVTVNGAPGSESSPATSLGRERGLVSVFVLELNQLRWV